MISQGEFIAAAISLILLIIVNLPLPFPANLIETLGILYL
jgi:hypothetical protein